MGRRDRATQDEGAAEGRRGQGHVAWLAPWLVLGLTLLTVVITLVLLGLSGRSIPVPDVLVDRIEARANRALAGHGSVNIIGADLVVSAGFVPQIRLSQVTLLSERGQRLATLSDLRGALHGHAFVRGRIEPQRLSVTGARLAIRRLEDGTFDIAPGAAAFSGMTRRPADILDALDETLMLPALAGLESVRVEGLAILFDDVRSGQVWTVSGGRLDLTRADGRMAMTLGFDLYGEAGVSSAGATAPGAAALGHAVLTLETEQANSAARLTATLTGVSARDLAAQVPALAWLGALDAPISGALESGFDAEGDLTPLTARLDIGPGALQPTDDTKPVRFDRAQLALAYDPAKSELTLSELGIDSPTLKARAAGTGWLKGFDDGVPDALVAQIRVDELQANPEGVFDDAVTIGEGLLDARVELDPFRLTIGQLVLVDQGHRIATRGQITAEPEGWAVALDMAVDAIQTDRLLALWPVAAVPKTRQWLIENVATGELFDVQAAMRLAPGREPRLALNYLFRGTEVRFLKTLPPVIDAAGYASINDYSYTLVAEKGVIRAPKGGDIDVSGSVITVDDLRARPTYAGITLKSRGSLTATLALLDEKPFGFMKRAGRPVDLAEGTAELVTDIRMPLIKKVPLKDLDYRVKGRLLDVRSATLAPGRVLTAAELAIAADEKGMSLSGRAALDGVPAEGAWRQDFGPEGRGKSRLVARVEITKAALDTFSIALPDGSVKGQGEARVEIAVERGKAPEMKLTSDLAGLALAIPEVGWSKPADRTGSLTVEATLGTPPDVRALSLSAAGLEASGRVVLKEDGGLDRAEFPDVRLSDWFEGDVTLTGRGRGRTVGVAIAGGSVDLRRADFGGGGGGEAPITVALDRLRISEGISLTDFRGAFAAGGGTTGTFTGLVNGAAPIAGAMAPADNGRAAFRIESEDAGLAIASAGLFGSGRGGRMTMLLQPEGPEGHYNGTVNIRSIRVVDAPALAGLLNAISVVGLITELQGAGIAFTDVEGRFRLTPEAVEIRQGSAVGASLGVSAAGVYRTSDGALDLQGVISPVYLLNGVGQIFSRQRDGLFGFNYTMTGTPEKTRVAVNPLSILTPGMFREIFRKPPPTLDQ